MARLFLRETLRSFLCVALSLAGTVVGLRPTAQPLHAAEPASTKPANPSSRDTGPVELINQQIRAGWQDHDLRPSRQATDAQWCRRVFLDLIGRVPTVSELDAFLVQKSSQKRRELVDRLLGEEYLDDYSNNWTTLWANVFVGRTGGRERRSLINRGGFEGYLQQSLLENKPYDQLAVELITATGSADPRAEDHSGAVNFLIEKLDENGIQATAKTAQIFLGMAVQCTQCHNHPFNEYRQNQFWELNAFFRQARVERTRDPDNENRRLGRIVNQDFAGEGRELYSDNRREIFLERRNGKLVDRDAEQLKSAPIYYELRNGQLQVAYPVFVDGSSLAEQFSDEGVEYGNSGYLEHVDRRRELAKLVTGARDFDRALVNRIWAHFFGYGFTKPCDDMGPHNPPSHAELMDKLGLAFRATSFDVKALLRWIVLSEPYALSSRIGSQNAKDDPRIAAAKFSRFYVRQMQAEQLYESLLVATQADETVSKERRKTLKDRWLRQFSTAFGTDDQAEATTFNGSIPQTLTMMNGDLIRRACSTDSGSFLDKIANDNQLTNRQKIGYLYRAALARQPSKEEINACNELLASRSGDVVGTLQDIWWAILNSNEFIFVH